MADLTPAEWAAIKARLTPKQVERIRAKCVYEQCSWLAVYEQWPSLFASEGDNGR